MKILWLSESRPLPRQIDALMRRFNVTERDIVHDNKHFQDAEEIVRRFRESGYDELVFFSSLGAIGRLCEMGARPYYPVMERVMAKDRERADLVVGRRSNERFFRFVKFRRAGRVIIEFVEGDEFE